MELFRVETGAEANSGSGEPQRPGESSYRVGNKQADGETARHWVASLTFMYYTFSSEVGQVDQTGVSNTFGWAGIVTQGITGVYRSLRMSSKLF